MFKNNKTIPTVLWGFFILYLTLRPKSGSPSVLPDWIVRLHPDKIAHFVFWAIWMVIFQITYLRKKYPFSKSVQFSQKDLHLSQLKFAICAIFIGAAIELLQLYLNWGRSAEWLDLLADSLGVVAVWLATLAYPGGGSINSKETQLR